AAERRPIVPGKQSKESAQPRRSNPSPNGRTTTVPRPAPAAALDDPAIQRAYLEELVECAPEAISILDDQYRIVRINGEFTRMFGFSPEEAIGRRIDSLIVPPDRS